MTPHALALEAFEEYGTDIELGQIWIALHHHDVGETSFADITAAYREHLRLIHQAVISGVTSHETR